MNAFHSNLFFNATLFYLDMYIKRNPDPLDLSDEGLVLQT